MKSEARVFAAGLYQRDIVQNNAERLVIRFPAADIRVRPSNAASIHIEIDIQGTQNLVDSWEPALRQRESLFIIADTGPSELLVREVRVMVPAGFRDLEVRGGAGSLDIQGIDTDILASSESGDIRIEGGAAVEVSSVTGPVYLSGMHSVLARGIDAPLHCASIAGLVSVESQSGSVQIEEVQGNIVVLTSRGEISVRKPGGRLRLISTSGDIDLELIGSFQGGEVNTATGYISLQLDEADIELRGETLSGTIHGPAGAISQGSGPRRCAMKLGEGGRRLHVKSVSGDIDIER